MTSIESRKAELAKFLAAIDVQTQLARYWAQSITVSEAQERHTSLEKDIALIKTIATQSLREQMLALAEPELQKSCAVVSDAESELSALETVLDVVPTLDPVLQQYLGYSKLPEQEDDTSSESDFQEQQAEREKELGIHRIQLGATVHPRAPESTVYCNRCHGHCTVEECPTTDRGVREPMCTACQEVKAAQAAPAAPAPAPAQVAPRRARKTSPRREAVPEGMHWCSAHEQFEPLTSFSVKQRNPDGSVMTYHSKCKEGRRKNAETQA